MAVPKRKPHLAALPSVEDLAGELIDDPDKWLDTERDQLGGEKP